MARRGHTYQTRSPTTRKSPSLVKTRRLRAANNLTEDSRGGGAVHAAGRVERVDTEQLVDQAAGDAKHGRAAVVALHVELEGLRGLVVVAGPRLATDVTRGLGRVLAVEDEEAGLAHAGDQHNLQPRRRRERLERREAAVRNVGELDAARQREVAREARASVDEDDVQEAHHRSAAVLDLHDLIAAHVALANEAKGVIDAQRPGHANVTLGEHGGLDSLGGGLEGRRLEGGGRLKERKGDDGDVLHG